MPTYAEPHKDNIAQLREELIPAKEMLRAVRRERQKKEEADALETKISSLEKDIREQEAIIADIDAKVFDLKAVNPNVVANMDTRTTIDVIDSIQAQAKVVEDAMNSLKRLLLG